MERVLLEVACVLALVAAAWGAWSVHRGEKTVWTFVFMALVFFLQLGFLKLRGDLRGACPLRDVGEVLVFLAWSLNIFYLTIGRSYRLSLMGIFSAPVVFILQAIALLPNVMEASPLKSLEIDSWRETHAAVSVLAFGAFALAAVAAVMFLVLDKQLKKHHLNSGLFKNLPPVRELLEAVQRLIFVGFLLLTFGLIAGWMMQNHGEIFHWLVAVLLWCCYAVLLVIKQWRGMTGKMFSYFTVGIFLISVVLFSA